MANNRNSNSIGWRRIVRATAFIGLIFIGIAILLGNLIQNIAFLSNIGIMLAVIVTSVLAYEYARSKRSAGFMIAWAVAFVLALVVIILQTTPVFPIW